MTLEVNYYNESQLSIREAEILQLVSLGYNSKEIAHKLFISELTVQTHRRNMVRRLGVKNTHHLITWAFKAGLFLV